VAVSLAAAVGILTVVVGLGAARLFDEVRELSTEALPEFHRRSGELLEQLAARARLVSDSLPDWVRTAVEENWAGLYRLLSHGLEGLLRWLQRVPQWLAVAAVSLLASFFISRDRQLLRENAVRLVPDSWRRQLAGAKAEVLVASWGFVRAQVILMALTGLLTFLGLSAVGSPYALTLGLICGVLDLLPLVGPTAVFLPWIGYHALAGSPAFAVKLAVVYVVVVGIRQAVEPRVVGGRIGLHPLLTLFSVYLGIQLFGAAGFFLGPLLAIVLKALVRSGLVPLTGTGGPPGSHPPRPGPRR